MSEILLPYHSGHNGHLFPLRLEILLPCIVLIINYSLIPAREGSYLFYHSTRLIKLYYVLIQFV